MNLLIPDWKDLPDNVGAVTTLRRGGVSLAPYDDGLTGHDGLNLAAHVGDNPEHVRKNRALLRQLLPSEPAWLTQTHSTIVVDAAGVKNAPEGDASVATERGVVCVTLTADCLPVILVDAKRRAVGVFHAGWRCNDGLVCQSG